MPNLDISSNFRAQVIIPTTTGPVAIIGLEETVGGFSTICLNKTSEQAAIAQKYKAFVKPPTGPLNRLFDREPYPTYRMDISGPISAGFSWQLAALISHALRADDNRLLFEAETNSALIWATGEVKSDLTIAQVGNVGDKLRNSQRLFEQALVEERPIFIFVPAENEGDVDPNIGQWLTERGVTIHLVTDIVPVLATLLLPGITQAASKPTASYPDFAGNPYRGLEPYRSEHRRLFFGRGRAREEALEHLRTAAARGRPFLLVHGQSGVGKSSLVQAGLVGDIEEQAIEGGRFRSAVITPSEGGSNPITALCRGIALLLDPPALEIDASISPPYALSLLEKLQLQAGASASKRSGLLIIDQLEEVFDPAVAPEQIEAFGDVVEKIVASRAVWVIATIRSDALGLLDRSAALARLANGERVYRLDRPSRYELSEIITAPMALAGRSFADRLIVEDFSDVAAQSPDSLPLLQAVLYRLYDQADRDNQLTAAGIKRIGGFEGAVSVWAEEVRHQMIVDGIASENIDRVLVSLVRIDPETRRPLSRALPYNHTADPFEHAIPDERRILDHVVSARLASTFAAADGPRIRLAHEVLTTHWPQLAALVERLSAAIILRDDVERRTLAWIASNKDVAELLRGPARLEAARTFVDEKLVKFDQAVVEFIEASEAEAITELEEARRFAEAQKEIALQEAEKLRAQKSVTRRTRVGAIAAASLAATAAVLAYEADRNRRELQVQVGVAVDARKDAEAKTKIADAQSTLARQYAEDERRAQREAGVMLAEARLSRAQLVARTVQPESDPDVARLALIETLPDRPEQVNFPLSGAAIRTLAETNAAEGTMIRLPTEDVVGGEFINNGGHFATLDGNGYLTVWDSETGAAVGNPFRENMASIVATTVSPNGKRLAVLKRSGEISIWDTTAYRLIERAVSSVEYASFLSLNDDGDELTVGQNDMTSIVFDVKRNAIVREFNKCTLETAPVAVTNEGRYFATIEDGKLHFCDGSGNEADRFLVVDGDIITAAAFSRRGDEVAVGTAKGELVIYDLVKLSELRRWSAHKGNVTYIAYPNEGKTIFSGSLGEVSLWEARTGNLLKRLPHGGVEGHLEFARLSGDGTRMFARFEHRPLASPAATATDNVMELNGLSGTLNGSSLPTWTVMGPTRNPANIVALTSGPPEPKLVKTFTPGRFAWNAEMLVRLISKTEPGSTEQSCETQTLEVWGASDEKRMLPITAGCDEDITLSLSGDGKRLLIYLPRTEGLSSSGIAQVWDIQTGKIIDQLEHFESGAGLFINKTGKLVAFDTGSQQEITVWNVGTGTLKRVAVAPSIGEGFVSGFSPDSNKLIYVSGSRVSLINSDTGAIEDELPPASATGVGDVAISEQQMLTAAIFPNQYVKIWDITTNKLLQETYSTDLQMKTIAFSPDGALIATGSNSGGVTVWDARTGALLATSKGHRNIVRVSFSIDGKTLGILVADHSAGTRGVLSWPMDWIIPSGTLASRERLTSFETLTPFRRAEMGIASVSFPIVDPPANVNLCDTVAADPWDPDRTPGTGRWRSELDSGLDNEQHCKDAISANPAEARFVYQLGRLLSARGISEAVPHYRKAAEAGYPMANYAYGLALIRGADPSVNPNAALSFLKAAFNRGVVIAAEAMGNMAWRGKIESGPPATLAIQYWTEGAAAGDPYSHLNLARIAEGGLAGHPLDLEKALRHFALAVELLEKQGDGYQDVARLRRGSLARILPPDRVAELWPAIRDWRPVAVNEKH